MKNVSKDENGEKYLSVFNNEGNERTTEKGDVIHKEADKKVKVTFKNNVRMNVVEEGLYPVEIEKIDDFNYYLNVPASSFVIIKF